MPSGKTHNKINQSVFILTVIIAIFRPHEYLWFYVLGLGIGVNYLGPDLDQNNSMQDQNWGIFHLYWNIYAKLMPHRGFSHSILGVLSRIVFLLPLFIIGFFIHQLGEGNDLLYSVNLFFDLLKNFFVLHHLKVIFTLLGILTADLLHIISDLLFVNMK